MAEVLYDLDCQDGVAQLVIDTAGPVNAIGPSFVADLEAAFDRAPPAGLRLPGHASLSRRCCGPWRRYALRVSYNALNWPASLCRGSRKTSGRHS